MADDDIVIREPARAEPAGLTVYVAHYRPRTGPPAEAPPYVAVCNVRPDGARPPGFVAYDDEGGLPEHNAAYNELSVLRRLQRRAETEWVGLVHYRRVLVARRPDGRRGVQPGTVHVDGVDWRRPEQWAGDEAALVAALGDAHWATPLPFDVRRAGYRSLWDHFVGNHPELLLRRAATAVDRLHPELEPLEAYLRREVRTPLYNVFLGRRGVLDCYASFLWPVLEACAPGLALDGYQGRWAGFLAERLHGYWLSQVAKPSGVRTGVLPLALLDVPLPPRRQRLTGILPAGVSLALLRAVRR